MQRNATRWLVPIVIVVITAGAFLLRSHSQQAPGAQHPCSVSASRSCSMPVTRQAAPPHQGAATGRTEQRPVSAHPMSSWTVGYSQTLANLYGISCPTSCAPAHTR
ncbi:MAG TPA: hypothetical protein VNL71_23555 [Chloroflexota bacterium]|nr:hypothetical protein [Chloroflexota bacterium]